MKYSCYYYSRSIHKLYQYDTCILEAFQLPEHFTYLNEFWSMLTKGVQVIKDLLYYVYVCSENELI